MTRRLVTPLLFSLALSACNGLEPAEERSIRRWLLCDECVDGELEAVTRLGDRAIGALRKALRGPPEEGRDNIRSQADAWFDRDSSVSLSRDEYVNHYVRNYEATYQTRAAMALREIGSPSAHRALLEALQADRPYREDVFRVLGQSVGVELSVEVGDSQSAPFNSVLPLDPVILLRDSVTGYGIGNVRVDFRVDSGGGEVTPPFRYTDWFGRARVRWQLGQAQADSLNILRADAAGRTVRLRAFGH